MPVDIVDETGREQELARVAASAAAAILACISHEHAELSIALVGDDRMRELNREWRGKDRATDVLSFPQRDDEPPARTQLEIHSRLTPEGMMQTVARMRPESARDHKRRHDSDEASPRRASPSAHALLGDVVVSVDTMRRQAADGGWTESEELVRLVLHGVLHLVGYDHERIDDAGRMHAEEARIVSELSERGIACAWESNA